MRPTPACYPLQVKSRGIIRKSAFSGGECHPPHGGGAQTLALPGPSRCWLAQCRHLLDDWELPTPRPQPAGISHRCPGSPTGIKDPPAGAVAPRQLEAADHELQLNGDPATTSPDQSGWHFHHHGKAVSCLPIMLTASDVPPVALHLNMCRGHLH